MLARFGAIALSLIGLIDKNECTLTIQSCVEVLSIADLDPVPESGEFYISVWVDNDKDNEKNTTLQSSGVTAPYDLTIDETFCWDYPTTDITTTGFTPNFARRVTLQVYTKNTHGYVVDLDFPDLNTFGGISTRSAFDDKTDVNFEIVSGTINYNLYHQATGGKLKISNRNHLIYKDCYILSHLCYYTPGVDPSSSTCNLFSASDILEANPDNSNKDNLDDTSNNWPSTSTSLNDECWEPYNQYVVIDLDGIEYGAIGLALDTSSTSSISTSAYQDDGEAPRFFSFGYAPDSLISGFTDNVGSDWQFWAVDLSDGTITNDGDNDDRVYVINPLWLQRDTQPDTSENIRFTQITSGVPEAYSNGAQLYYKGSASLITFNTWTSLLIYTLSFEDDGNDDMMGELATVACQNVFGSGSGYTGAVTSLATVLDQSSACWGTAALASTCETDVFGPPMRFTVYAQLSSDSYCGGVGADYNFGDCVAGATNGEDCDGQDIAECGAGSGGADAEYVSYMLTEFSCVEDTQITTVKPSEDPTSSPSARPTVSPTMAPTLAPTLTPTLAPSTSPTMAPTPRPNNDPTSDPTLGPSNMPSTEPSIMPSNDPSVNPSGMPSSLPTTMPSQYPTVPMTTQEAATSTENGDDGGQIIVDTGEPDTTETEPTQSEAVGGENNEEPEGEIERIFQEYLWAIIAVTAGLLLCCILLMVFCYRRNKEKQPRNFGDAKQVELQQGLPRPLSASDELKPERLRPDKLNEDDMGGVSDDDLYGGPTTDGDPAVTGMHKKTDEGVTDLEGGDPAVTGGPTPGSLSTPAGGAVRSSVASNASDVFSSPEEDAMKGQMFATDAGPDQALEVLVGNDGPPRQQPKFQPRGTQSVQSESSFYQDDDNDVVQTKDGSRQTGNYKFGVGLPKPNVNQQENLVQYQSLADKSPQLPAAGRESLEYGDAANAVNDERYRGDSAIPENMSVRSETLLGMAGDGDGGDGLQ